MSMRLKFLLPTPASPYLMDANVYQFPTVACTRRSTYPFSGSIESIRYLDGSSHLEDHPVCLWLVGYSGSLLF